MQTGYSYTTSLPAHRENRALNKRTQCDNVLALIKRGADNLLQISQVMNIPQSTISARLNDLINEQEVKYSGHVVYEGRLRKKIILIEKQPVKQANLF